MSRSVEPNEALAQLLSGSLRKMLPSGFSIVSDENWVVLYYQEQRLVSIAFDEGPREMLPAKVVNALSSIQDEVIYILREFWPRPHDRAPDVTPLPNADASDGFLHIWFGDRRWPALALEPLELSRIVG